MVLEERDRCPGCGQPLTESTRDDAEGRYSVTEAQCSGCLARETVADGKHYKGRMLAVWRKPD